MLAKLCREAADIVPIGLALDDRDVYTLWAPRWRDAGDEWEAFLGKDEDLYAFDSVPDLVAFVRANDDNDLADHPAWQTLTAVSAHQLDPDDDKRFDLIKVYELLAEKPTPESVEQLAGTLAIASAIGSGRWTQSASGPSGRLPSTRTGCPGLPTTVECGGTSWITTVLAPIFEP